MKSPLLAVFLATICCLLTLQPVAAQSTGVLLQQLKSDSADTRATAAYQLGHGCDRSAEAVPHLVKALQDPAWHVRSAAAEALGFFPGSATQATPQLVVSLKDEYPSVRQAAALSLGRLGSGTEEVLKALAQSEQDSNDIVRMSSRVSQALLGKRDPTAMHNLVNALSSGEQLTAAVATDMLLRVGMQEPDLVVPPLVAVLETPKKVLSEPLVNVLQGLGPLARGALPALVALYGSMGDQQRLVLLQTVLTVDDRGEDAASLLTIALQDSDPGFRKRSLVSVARYPHAAERLAKPLTTALNDRDPANRILAIRIVRTLGEQASSLLPALIERIGDEDSKVRLAAVEALGGMGGPAPETLAALEGAVQHSDPAIRAAAVLALARIGKQEPGAVMLILEKALEGESVDSRREFIAAVISGLQRRPQPRAGRPVNFDKQPPSGNQAPAGESLSEIR